MKTRRFHIVLGIIAMLAAAVLFVTYGTAPPAAPFASIQLEGPTVVDSNGECSVVVDAESRRALILDADGGVTGIVSCSTIDSPFDAITDACVSGGRVFVSGVRFTPDSDYIELERVVAYDKGGNPQGIICEIQGTGVTTPPSSR